MTQRSAQIGHATLGNAQLGSASSSPPLPGVLMTPLAGHTAGARTISVYYSGGAVCPASMPITIDSGPGSVGTWTQVVAGANGNGTFVYTQVGPSSTNTVFLDSVTSQTQIYYNDAVVPSAPQAPVAVNGNNQATVSFTAPSDDGGAAITGYTVTSSPGGITATGAASPITVVGLTNDVYAYTFTVKATNSAGDSAASTASNSVTPTDPSVLRARKTIVAPFFESDVLGTVTCTTYAAQSGSMVAQSTATVRTTASVTNGRNANVVVVSNSNGDARFAGVVVWDTGSEMFADELNIAPTIYQNNTYSKICKIAAFPPGTDVSGTLGYQLYDSDNAAFGSHVTTGIMPIPGVTDGYCAELTLITGWNGLIVWDNGAGAYASDEVVVHVAAGSYGAPSEIATAVLAAAAITPIAADVQRVRSQTLTGNGSTLTPWNPA